jgi:flagellum-specific peptidoglycan hydrolase FlgJ
VVITRADREQFVRRVLRACAIARAKGAVFNARAAIAQAALESAWGTSLLAARYNNLFGMKAGTAWRGPVTQMPTKEWDGSKYIDVVATWRVYPSWNECLVDYGRFIRDHLVDRDQPGEMAWATGPDYVRKILRVYQIVVAVADELGEALPVPSTQQILADAKKVVQ